MTGRVARVVVLLGACLLSAVPAAVDPLDAFAVEPSRVPVGLFFTGATLHVTGRVPDGCEAAVRLSSEAERLELKEKGRVGGLLWMSVGDVVFASAPVLYQLLTTTPLDRLAPPSVLDEWRIGYASVVVPADAKSAGLIPELVTLKERDGLYADHEGGLRLSRTAGDARIDGDFTLPASVRPGTYSVVLVGFAGGGARELGRATVVVERVGVVRMMWRLAMEHGLFYGSTAVLIALVAGLFTGLLFRSKRHGAH